LPQLGSELSVGRVDRPVDVHHAVRGLEDLAYALGCFDLCFIGGSVDLRHQGRQHRRSGRDLGDLHGGLVGTGD
jgi:hypothetical protein